MVFNDKDDMMISGYIYIMSNLAFEKDVYKIGRTAGEPELRAARLSRSTSAPQPFEVERKWYVTDTVKAEQLVHDALQGFRINKKREYFRVNRQQAIIVVERTIAELRQDNPANLKSCAQVQNNYSNRMHIASYKHIYKRIDEISNILNNTN